MNQPSVPGGGGWPWLLPLFLLILAISAPAWAGPGVLFLVGLTLIQSVFALSWSLLFSSTGLVSFGHAGFFAIGAYLTGGLLRYEVLPFSVALVLSLAVGALVAFLVGLLALQRLAGIFLAVMTVALAEILAKVISYIPALGGEDGLSNIPRASFLGIPLTEQIAYYWFLVVVTSIVSLALWWLVNSRTGRVFVSIREDAERATFLSTDVRHYRLVAFVISGAVAALAGALFAPWTRIVTLDEVHWLTSTQPILATLLGGASYFWGPVVGSIAFTVINYATRTFVGLNEVVVGGTLLIIILIAPSGILGLVQAVRARFRQGRAAGRDTAPVNATDKRS